MAFRRCCCRLTEHVPVGSIDFTKVRIDVTPREKLVNSLVDEQRSYFERNRPDYFDSHGLQDASGIVEKIAKKLLDWKVLRRRYQRQDYGIRMAVTTMNHINNEDWAKLFGIKELYLEVSVWLWIIHMWIIQKRLAPIPDNIPIAKAMMRVFRTTTETRYREIYETSSEVRKIQMWIDQTYNSNLLGLDEPFHEEVTFRDAILLYALYRNSPFEHREEVPFYAWYTLVHYIRLHLAVFDRIPNKEFRQGFFFFYHPLDPSIFGSPATLDSPSYVKDLLRAKNVPSSKRS
eukprot:Sspe_Gene.112669::Locus_95827_Transcript_1_1_Confidence_1.000_Length_1037::g.112669::m.112669